MPIETIKCQECGSADVTEFKSGSYVCGHCEAVFKHVSPVAAGGGCGLDGCGVPAVGRCFSCTRRFCKTHQARDQNGLLVVRTYDDFCTACQAQQALLREEAEQQRAAGEARRLDDVRTVLPTATDPSEIVRLLAAAASFEREWVTRSAPAYVAAEPVRRQIEELWSPCETGWVTLVRSGALRPADMDVVQMRFHKALIGRGAVTDLWRRPAWSDKSDGGQRCWLDNDGSLWCVFDDRYTRSMGLGSDSLQVATFAVPRNHPTSVTSHTGTRSTGERFRYWGIDGGFPVADQSGETVSVKVPTGPRGERYPVGVVADIASASVLT